MKRSLGALLSATLLAACAPDQSMAPDPIDSPLFLLGGTPTNSLLGETPTIRYDAEAGVLAVRIDLNQGILNASQMGNANFGVRTTLTITDGSGRSIIVGGECPLTDVNVVKLDDPQPHPFLLIEYLVSWNGRDQNGEPMSGQLTANYSIEIEARKGSVAVGGSTELIGTTPTSNLVGVMGIEYVAGEGLRLHMAANAGLIEAAQMGQAGFALQIRLVVTGAGGNGIIATGECPLSDIKVDLADPRPHPFIEFDFGVPWDGKDTEGNAMTGTVQVSYTAGIVFEPNGAEIVTLGGGPVTGFFDVFLGGVLQ